MYNENNLLNLKTVHMKSLPMFWNTLCTEVFIGGGGRANRGRVIFSWESSSNVYYLNVCKKKKEDPTRVSRCVCRGGGTKSIFFGF